LIFLAFLFPVALYCLGLAFVNRSRHPVLIRGTWDFAGVLFAASGFLLLGGPVILSGLYREWRLAWLLGQSRFLAPGTLNWNSWLGVWLLYFVVVAGGAMLLLYRRRNTTSIYNIEPTQFEEILSSVFERLGLEVRASGTQRFLLSARVMCEESDAPVYEAAKSWAAPQNSEGPAAAQTGAGLLAVSTSASAELRVDPFPPLHHVSLHWSDGAGMLRTEVEAELNRTFADTLSPRSPVAGFFMSLSTGLFFLLFAGALFLLVLRIFELPR
jgi:hypothetical protein